MESRSAVRSKHAAAISRSTSTMEDIHLGPLPDTLKPRIGSPLPTNGDVLGFYLHLRRGSMMHKKQEDVITLVVESAIQFWIAAGIERSSVFIKLSKTIGNVSLR